MEELKPFDLKEALAGKPVRMRNGVKIIQIFHADKALSSMQVIAVTEARSIWMYDISGQYSMGDYDHRFELRMGE